ncbi:MAG: tetratricopeptide repeat protein [Flammeovirgaceae bacterium]
MKIQKIALLVLAFTLFLGGGVSAQKKDKKKKKKTKKVDPLFANVSKLKSSVSDREEEFAMDSFTEGMKFFILQEYEKALEKFQESAEFVPENAATQYQIAYTYTKIGKFDSALPHAEKALELDDTNEYYYDLLGDIYKYNGSFDKAVAIYKKKIDKLKPVVEQYYLDLAAAYLSQGAYKEAIGVYDNAEKIYGFNEGIIRQKQKIYLKINNVDKAIQEGEKLLAYFPNSPELVLDQVQLLMTTPKMDQAVTLLEDLLEENPSEARAKFLLSDVYRLKGESEKSAKMLEESFKSPNLGLELKLDVLAGYLQRMHNAAEREIGLKLSKITVETHVDEPKANVMYADFLMALQNEDNKIKAREHYMKAVNLDGNDFNSWRQIVGIDFELGQMDSIVSHTESALEYFPNQAIFYLQNGAGLMSLKKYEEARDALEQGKMLATGNPQIAMQFNSYLGDLYHNLEEYEQSDAAFEAVLSFDKDDLHALNNYSYFLSLRKEKLDLAAKMSARLIELEPNNGTYLDTYGWVLYVQGKYEDARKVLEKAVQHTVSGAVLEHYGDVLYRLGEKEAAIIQWKRAKILGGVSDEKILDQKLAEGKLIE